MKKLIALSLLVVGLCAAQTYTNGLMSQRLPVADADYAKLKLLRQIDGITNVPLSQYSTNFLVAKLSPDAESRLNDLRTSLASQIQECEDEDKLIKVKKLLEQ